MTRDPEVDEADLNHAGAESDAPALLRVKVTIDDSEPLIWRILDLDSSLPLDAVHRVLQCAVGWRDSHLHCFTDAPQPRGVGEPLRRWAPEAEFEDAAGSGPVLPEGDWTLGQALGADGQPLWYEYDFGDGWIHRLERLATIPADQDAMRARLVDGARRAPLEDSGGIGGYHQLLGVLADPGHDDYADLARWVAAAAGPWQSFDPAALDIAAVNAELAQLYPPSPARPGDSDPTPARELIARMPAGLRTEFRCYLNSALDGPAGVERALAEAMVAPYLWLIRRIGPAGLDLTTAGMLPPAVVREAMDELGWGRDWPGKSNREHQTPPVLRLRESARRLGLVRLLKGRLVLGAAARRLLEDPIGLWRFLAGAIAHRYRHDSERDAVLLLLVEIAAGKRVDRDESVQTVSFGLAALGWRDADGVAPTLEPVEELLRGHREFLARLGVFDVGGAPWRTGAVTPQGRAFARAALLVWPVVDQTVDLPRTGGFPWGSAPAAAIRY